MNKKEQKALSLLGLAARAGRVAVGVPAICEALKKGGSRAPLLVLSASNAAPNSKKRITDRTAYYKVSHIVLEATADTLAHAVGKEGLDVVAVGVTEPHLAAQIKEELQKEE